MCSKLDWRSFSDPPTKSDGLRSLIENVGRVLCDQSYCFYSIQILLLGNEIERGRYYYNRPAWVCTDAGITSEKMIAWRPDPETNGLNEIEEVPTDPKMMEKLFKEHEIRIRNAKSMSGERPLFHFTRKFEYLCSIIASGFNHRKSKESLPLRGANRGTLGDFMMATGAINSIMIPPLVCFCDMEKYEMTAHREQYGSYAIGLTKQWGVSNSVTPARYVHENSYDLRDPAYYDASDILSLMQTAGDPPSRVMLANLGINISQLPQNAIAVYDLLDQTLVGFINHVMINTFLLKEYKGLWTDRVTALPTYRTFYDEREWRSVRSTDVVDNLMFHWDDITDVIVEYADEIPVITEGLRRYVSECPDDTAQIVMKVKTMDEFL